MDYQKQQENNDQAFMELLRAARPSLWQIAQMIDDYQLNPNILIQVILGLESIMSSTRYGVCSIEITDGVVHFIRAQNHKKVMEPVKTNEENY